MAVSFPSMTGGGGLGFGRRASAGPVRRPDEAQAAGARERAEPEPRPSTGEADPRDRTRPRGADGAPMSDGDLQVLHELQARDREVRSHEAAHQAVGGAHAGGASFSYQTGPDGKRYAIGGEVPVDLSSESDPQASIAKLQQVRAAALAPADPSSQDRAVAAQASAMIAEAQQALMQQPREARSAEDPAKALAAYGKAAGTDGPIRGREIDVAA